MSDAVSAATLLLPNVPIRTSLPSAGRVEPEVHKKTYANWGPIRLADGPDDPASISIREISLNLVIQELRMDTYSRSEKSDGRTLWHPDSRTAITSTESGVEPGGIESLIQSFKPTYISKRDEEGKTHHGI